jgi:hypothetical protein
MSIALTIANTAISLAFIVLMLRHISTSDRLLTRVAAAAYVAATGLFIVTNIAVSADYGYGIKQEWVDKAVYANLAFIGLALLASSAKYPRSSRHESDQNLSQGGGRTGGSGLRVNATILVIMATAVIVVEARYLFLSGGLARVQAWFDVTDRSSLYAFRYDPSLTIGEGAGQFTAMLAQKMLFPIVAVGFAHLIIFRRRWDFAPLAAVMLILNGLTAAASLQRSPVFMFFLVTVLAAAWGLGLRSRRHPRARRWRYSVVGVTMLAFGGLIYTYTERAPFLGGLYGLVERSVLIPSFASTSYYGLFGRTIPFQGPSVIWGFAYARNSSGLSYWDIGRQANGWDHCLNCGFVGTSYAGLGFLGVVLVSAIVLVGFRLVDRYARNYSRSDKVALLIANVYPIFEICNGPLGNGIMSGLFINVLVFGYVFRERRRAHRMSYTLLGRGGER